MNRKLIISGALIVFFSACAKKEGPQTPYNNIQGTWRLVQTATDDNGNGELDNSEIQDIAANDIESFQYNNDGTGVQNVNFNGTVNNYTFIWAIINNNKDIQTIFEGHDTVVSHIITLSENYMTYMNTTPSFSWYFFRKK